MTKPYKKRKTKYSVQNVRLYHIWYGMLERCRNEKNRFFHRYGGRGIGVCKEWNDYEAFSTWAMNHGYQDGLSIDRINNDGDYKPDNCRWVTAKQQHYNTSQCRYETIDGVTKCIAEWAAEYGIRHGLVLHRLARGMSIVEALTKKTLRAKDGIPVRCVDTGEEFISSKDAAIKYGRTTSAIARAARTGSLSCGMRWEQIWTSEK